MDWKLVIQECIPVIFPASIIPFNSRFYSSEAPHPGFYQLLPPQSQSVSVSQPLSSTSACYRAPPGFFVAPSPLRSFITPPPHTTTTTTITTAKHPMPLREPCQSQAYKKGVDVGPQKTASSPLLPCSVEDEISLRWTDHGDGSLQTTRQRCLASTSPSTPALQSTHKQPQHPPLSRLSTSLGSVPIIPLTLRLTSRPSCLFAPRVKAI